MTEKSDHDLLTEINRDMTWIREWSHEHMKDGSAFHAIIAIKVDAAHKRIDGMYFSGILSLILLSLTSLSSLVLIFLRK